MYLNVLICDDEVQQVEILKTFLKDFMSMNSKYDVNIYSTTNSKEAITKVQDTKFDIAFLDIEMKPYNGIEVGRVIRKLNKTAIIIFITGFKDYALNAFEINAFNYQLKPITIKRFYKLMLDVCRRIEEQRLYESMEKIFTIKTGDSLIKLKTTEIYCFEKVLRKVRVYTYSDTYEFYSTFKTIVEKLDMEREFIQVHQGYIVNRRMIVEMDCDNIYLRDINLHVPVRRIYKGILKEILAENLFN